MDRLKKLFKDIYLKELFKDIYLKELFIFHVFFFIFQTLFF